jgi:hypothetical protein
MLNESAEKAIFCDNWRGREGIIFENLQLPSIQLSISTIQLLTRLMLLPCSFLA